MLLKHNSSEIVNFLHSFPHLSLKFKHLSDPEFTFDDTVYLESLTVVALFPVVILFITLISYLIYYCCVEIKQTASNKTNSKSWHCSVYLLLTFILLTLVGISLAIYGSVRCHDGMDSASSAIVKINQSVSNIKICVDDIQTLNVEFSNQVEQLTEMYPNDTYIKKVNDTAHMIYGELKNLPEHTLDAHERLEWTVETMREMEQYRTIVTFFLVSFQGLVCMLGLAGVCFRSKCLLITATFIGLICLVASYLYAGINLMTDVGVSDLCMNPYEYIMSQAVSKLFVNNVTTEYYMWCLRGYVRNDVYSPAVASLHNWYERMSYLLIRAQMNHLPSSPKNLFANASDTNYELTYLLGSMRFGFDCEDAGKAARGFVASICGPTVDGIFIISVSLISIGLTLTAVLCAAPKTWKRYTKRQRNDDDDIELDVVLPPVENASSISRTNDPNYISNDDRGSRLSSKHSEENLSLLDSPPPYSPHRESTT